MNELAVRPSHGDWECEGRVSLSNTSNPLRSHLVRIWIDLIRTPVERTDPRFSRVRGCHFNSVPTCPEFCARPRNSLLFTREGDVLLVSSDPHIREVHRSVDEIVVAQECLLVKVRLMAQENAVRLIVRD